VLYVTVFYKSLLSVVIIRLFDVPIIRRNTFYFLEIPVLPTGG